MLFLGHLYIDFPVAQTGYKFFKFNYFAMKKTIIIRLQQVVLQYFLLYLVFIPMLKG